MTTDQTPTQKNAATSGGRTKPVAQRRPRETGFRYDGRQERVSLTLLMASVAMFIAWPVSFALLMTGLAMMVTAHRWNAADKLLGLVTFGILGPPSLVIMGLGYFASGKSGQASWVGGLYFTLTIVMLGSSMFYLLRRARAWQP